MTTTPDTAAATQTKTLLRFATAGSADDGKSTLVGRLLHDTKAILADQLEAVTRTRAERGFVGGELASPCSPTIGHILDDRSTDVLTDPVRPGRDAIVELLESKGVAYVDWQGYHRLEAAEKALGEAQGRERVKIATREDMLREAREQVRSESHFGT